MSATDSLWGPINMRSWSSVRFLAARVAEERDVKEGRAVFYLQDATEFAGPFSMPLPRCAWLKEEGRQRIPVVVIQAEKTEKKIYIGYRDLVGGNGICTLEELDFVEQPDGVFFQKKEPNQTPEPTAPSGRGSS